MGPFCSPVFRTCDHFFGHVLSTPPSLYMSACFRLSLFVPTTTPLPPVILVQTKKLAASGSGVVFNVYSGSQIPSRVAVKECNRLLNRRMLFGLKVFLSFLFFPFSQVSECVKYPSVTKRPNSDWRWIVFLRSLVSWIGLELYRSRGRIR